MRIALHARLCALLFILAAILSGCGGSDSSTASTSQSTVRATTTVSTWTFCAKEDGVCNFSGTTRVRYGLNGTYAILTATNTIGCNNTVFGDPFPGVDKICEYETVSSEPPPTSGWTFCANEDGVCNFSGTMQVRYGLNGIYAYRIATGTIPCNNQTFGDPYPGANKICEYAPTDTTPPPPPPTGTNPTLIENTKTGTTGWRLTNPATAGEIEGYASLTSVAKGSSIDLYVNTVASTYRIDIYRMGYYGGAGARLMRSISSLAGIVQPKPCLNPSGVIECNWTVSTTLTIPNDVTDPASTDYWASGVYLAKLTTNSTPAKDAYIIFVVRDDARSATYVSQLPVTTYQAYNYWGGKSLYTGCIPHTSTWACSDGSLPPPTVSFNRPYAASTNPAAAYGVGAGEFIANLQPVAEGYPISSAGFDYNMVRWMERNGYDVKYVTNMDLHQNPNILSGARAFISTGHDEYYSRPMWNKLVQSRDTGINLGFFSSNEIYWQVRFANGSYGSTKTDRIMICYRNGGDPVTDPTLRTARFRDLGIPEASLVGAQYVADPIMGDVSITNAAHWLFTGSGATNSTVLPGLLGYEINAIAPGISPANVVSLANTSWGGQSSDMTYYVAPSTAQVFATGTMQWSWGLDSFISNGLRPDYASPIAQKITENVFSALAEMNLYSLQNASSSFYMSTPPGNIKASQLVQAAAPTDGSRTNQWRLTPTGDGHTYQVTSRATGLCLDAYGATEGSVVGTWECNGLAHQKWVFTDLGSGRFTLSDTRSLRCIDLQSSGAGAGSGLVLHTCNSSSATQQWKRTAL